MFLEAVRSLQQAFNHREDVRKEAVSELERIIREYKEKTGRA